MPRSITMLLGAMLIVLLMFGLALWRAFAIPDMAPWLELRLFIIIFSLLTAATVVVMFLPVNLLRRESADIRELTQSIVDRRPKIFSGPLSELSTRVSVLVEELKRTASVNHHRVTDVERTERLAAIGHLAAGLAHEIRNPITNVIGFAALARERCTDESLLRDLVTIEQEARRCESITDSILAFSRTPKICRDIVELAELFLGAQDHPASDEKGLEISVRIDENVPRIEGDKTLLKRVTDNLFRNAREAGATQVQIKAERVGADVKISVADNGSGIPVSGLETLFDPFATGKAGGLGLGLAISRGIISAHHGTIKAANRPQGGAQFEIMLPVSQSPRCGTITQ